MKQKPALHMRRTRVFLPAKNLICCLDRLITTCQEWLEGPEKPSILLVEKAVLIVSALYFAAHVVLWLCR